jgi:2-amino-4-hydroxy-6-hydroxymethyldihydropteridine diphosphokinase
MREAVGALGRLPGTSVTGVSRLYRTPPWGDTNQDDFLNAVARLETALGAPSLLTALLDIEYRLGRRRDRERRWGPRPIDLDLLLFNDSTVSAPGLEVPHPRLHERGFVLVPLLELEPGLVVPGRGLAADLLEPLDRSGIEPVGAAGWHES